MQSYGIKQPGTTVPLHITIVEHCLHTVLCWIDM